MSETDTAVVGTVDPGLLSEPGTEHYPALDLANSAIAQAGDRFVDAPDAPSGANQWPVDRESAPADAGMQDICGRHACAAPRANRYTSCSPPGWADTSPPTC